MSTIAHQPSKNASQHKIYTAPLPTDRYTLLDRINTASSSEMFGTLHRALERSTNRALVIRVLNGLSEEVQTAMISCFTSMFAAPQQVSGCLSALQEVYVHKDTVWLLHPYNANGSVYDFMQTQKGKRIGHEETIRMLLRNVVHYIAQLHAHSFYHGHIKASNLLLHGGDDGIEIADYGLAQYQLKYGLPSDITSTYLHWAPPESCSGSISTTNDECRPENDDANRNQTKVAIRPAAWDIWTIGTLAFELSIGAPPYVQFAPRRAHALIRDHSPPILVGNFSPLLKAFVARCLTKDLEKRPTAAQLCEDAYLVGTTSGGAQTKKHYSNSMNAPAVLSNYVTPPRSNGNTRVLSGRTRSASRHFTSTTSGSATNSSELSYGSNAPWVHRVPCAPTYPDKDGHLSLHDALTRALENVHCYPPATQTTGNSKVGLNTNEDAHIEDTTHRTLPVSTTTTVLRLLRVLEALESMSSIPGNDTKVSHISFSDVFRCRLQETLHDVGSSIVKASNESGELVTCCEGITPQRLYATLLRRWKEESKRVLEGNERQSD